MAQKRKKQKLQRRVAIWLSAVLLGIIIVGLFLRSFSFPVLEPAGPIAAGQKSLLITAFLLMLIVVLPVFTLAFVFAWRYRDTNKKATYKPDWDSNNLYELIWWLIPAGLIAVLAVITWHGTFKYDPYRPLAAPSETLTVQVVALDWRWLFIYPEQKVASVNELYLPVDKAVRFEITSDAPMNSFWIPQLGGQVYAMPGMGTLLHLKADRTGTFYGTGANISGEGFADMNFDTVAVTQRDFDAWVDGASSQPELTKQRYEKLSQPKVDDKVLTFSDPANGLYGTIIGKYMSEKDTGNGKQQHGGRH